MAKPLHKLIPCVRSIRRKLLWHQYATWKPRKEMFVTDCFSLAPAKQVASTQELGVDVEVRYIIRQLSVSPDKLQEFWENTANDADLQLVQNKVMRGWSAERKKYLNPLDHILHFATKSCTPIACFFEEISW